MILTSVGRRTPRDPTKFPTTQLALLALVRVAEPIALTSILPYAFKLVLHFHIGDESHASFYSGVLIAAFSLAEALSGMLWGGVSDRIGRKPVLLFGCFGTLLSLLIIGFAPSFWVALFGRIMGGLLNGNIGVIQTMVGELVTLPEHEPRAYAVLPLMWALGTVIGPAIGGFFSEPCTNYPSMCSPHSLFERFPFLLPNLVCASLMFVAIVAGIFLIEETHPDMQPWSSPSGGDAATSTTPLMVTAGATDHAPPDLRNASYGTFNAVEVQDNRYVTKNGCNADCPEISRPKLLSRRVVMLITALGIFTYHSMVFDTLVCIFFEDARGDEGAATSSSSDALSGGLGLTMQQVGGILALNGIIALFVQAVIFPLAASWLGIWKLFILTTLGHPLVYFIVPYLTFLPESTLFAGIYATLSLRNLFSIIAYPVLLILLKGASPGPSYLGKINGLAASVGAACRTLASPIAGSLYGVGIDINFTPLAWWVNSLVAIIGALQMFLVYRPKKETAVIRDVTQYTDDIKSDDPEVVHIFVEDYSDASSDEEATAEGRHE